MVNVDEAMASGDRHLQAGQFAEAEKIYRRIVQVEPRNALALNQLGLLALRTRQFGAAAQWFETAIRHHPAQAAFHANLGEAYRHMQKLHEAISCYRAAVKVQPGFAQFHVNLATLYVAAGKSTEAIASLRTALELNSEDVHARAQLGRVLHEQRLLGEAETCFRRVVRSMPASSEAHFELGSVLQAQGKLDEAAACYRTALELRPDYPAAHNNLGNILRDQGSLAAAAGHYQAAVTAAPGLAEAHVNLGALFQRRGELDNANVAFRAALQADPNLLAARYALGGLLLRQEKFAQAAACYHEVLRIVPHSVRAQVGLGSVFQAQGSLDAAIACYQKVIRFESDHAAANNELGANRDRSSGGGDAIDEAAGGIDLDASFAVAHNNLGVLLRAVGRLDEAITHHRTAVRLYPNGAAHHSNLLYALNYDPAYDAATIFAEHRAWAQRHADPLTAASPPHLNDRTRDRRLRVGYVSPNFRAQAVNFFSEPILASHDHQQFEVFCYSDVKREDEITQRLKGYADHWRNIVWQSHQEASDLVRRDEIDILVDLTGHISGNRLLLFARKPAPLQVTYIGYQNTTGMKAMDYRLTDAWSDPAGETDAYYTEQLVRLPRSFFCYMPPSDAPDIAPLPLESNGHVTFGSFNDFTKVSLHALDAWARLLLGVPRSRLIVLAYTIDLLKDHLYGTLGRHGIDPDRIEVIAQQPHRQYLDLIQRVDIALDPFPFNGHTTTCDCLWLGIPVVTLSGQTYASRFGGSGLVTLGLTDLVAHTTDDYVQTAAGLAADIERLKQLRGSLRERMAGSPLVDFASFTRNLEAEYRRMWVRWCAS
ncbi:MAG: tetratricopeptide repeat protein [Planctomycetia bacterium]|nr:tetratricopeptide repeat protein [Planctomycetia bacterium]